LAKKFGLTPEQFGENLRDNYQRHEVEQEPTEPMEVAREFISKYVTFRSII
jgi:transcription elongation factor SPT6